MCAASSSQLVILVLFLASRVPHIGVSIFKGMSRLSISTRCGQAWVRLSQHWSNLVHILKMCLPRNPNYYLIVRLLATSAKMEEAQR